MSVAINAVEGYDGAESGCMQLANDCNGHYLPAEWSMNPTSRFTWLQTLRVATGLTHFLSTCSLSHYTLYSFCVKKNTHIHVNLKRLRCLQTGVREAALLLRGPTVHSRARANVPLLLSERSFYASIFYWRHKRVAHADLKWMATEDVVERVDKNKAADKENARAVKCCKGKVAPLASVATQGHNGIRAVHQQKWEMDKSIW